MKTRKNFKFGILIAILILVPFFIQVSEEQMPSIFSAPWNLGLPKIHSGDEPHYFLMLNSLLQYGDLDLANSYQRVHSGSKDAGVIFAASHLDHHVSYYVDGKCYLWDAIYDYSQPNWKISPKGKRIPPTLPGSVSIDPDAPEYAMHPPGLPLFLSVFLYPFKNSVNLESLAILFSALAVFAIGLLLLRLEEKLEPQSSIYQKSRGLPTLLALFGTPLWHYSKGFFVEPYLALILTAFFYYLSRNPTELVFEVESEGPVKKRKYYETLFMGLFISIGMLMKPPFLLVVLPYFCVLLKNRKYRELLFFSIFPTLALGTLAFLNLKMFGSIFRTSLPFQLGNPLTGVAGLLFSKGHGLFSYSPFLLFSLVGWGILSRDGTRKTWIEVSLVSCLLYFLMISIRHFWDGGWCFGPRLILPIFPFLSLGIGRYFQSALLRKSVIFHATWVACLISVLINLLGVIYHPWFWSQHPLF